MIISRRENFSSFAVDLDVVLPVYSTMDSAMDVEGTQQETTSAAPVRESGQVNFNSHVVHEDAPTATAATDTDINALKAQVSAMEQESAKLHEMQKEMLGDGDAAMAVDSEETNKHLSIQERQEIDGRSVHVGNIDYAATPEEVHAVFKDCGTINRITILTNKATGTPMGYGYVEFASQESVSAAIKLDQTLLRGRELKVSAKRTNVPGFGRGGFRGRGGRGGRGAGRGGRGGRGAFRGRGSFRGRGGPRGRGDSRGRGGFQPY